MLTCVCVFKGFLEIYEFQVEIMVMEIVIVKGIEIEAGTQEMSTEIIENQGILGMVGT